MKSLLFKVERALDAALESLVDFEAVTLALRGLAERNPDVCAVIEDDPYILRIGSLYEVHVHGDLVAAIFRGVTTGVGNIRQIWTGKIDASTASGFYTRVNQSIDLAKLYKNQHAAQHCRFDEIRR